jgi:hypothetical protein
MSRENYLLDNISDCDCHTPHPTQSIAVSELEELRKHIENMKIIDTATNAAWSRCRTRLKEAEGLLAWIAQDECEDDCDERSSSCDVCIAKRIESFLRGNDDE